jgi:hypothetical protein
MCEIGDRQGIQTFCVRDPKILRSTSVKGQKGNYGTKNKEKEKADQNPRPQASKKS